MKDPLELIREELARIIPYLPSRVKVVRIFIHQKMFRQMEETWGQGREYGWFQSFSYKGTTVLPTEHIGNEEIFLAVKIQPEPLGQQDLYPKSKPNTFGLSGLGRCDTVDPKP